MRESTGHPMPRIGREWIAVLLAAGALGIGVAVYLLDRGGNVYFVTRGFAWTSDQQAVFGRFAGSLPSFAHTFAFALLTAAAVQLSRQGTVMACASWALINGLFEIAQRDATAKLLSRVIGDRLEGVWLLDQSAKFFAQGTFDVVDLFAIGVGSVVAYLVIRMLNTGP